MKPSDWIQIALIVALTVAVIFLLVLNSRGNKVSDKTVCLSGFCPDKSPCPGNDCTKCNALVCGQDLGGNVTCDKLKNMASTGFGRFADGANVSVLKLQNLNYDKTTGKQMIAGPLYFPNGISIYNDPIIPNPQPRTTQNMYFDFDAFTTRLVSIVGDSNKSWPPPTDGSPKLYYDLLNVNPDPTNINFFREGIDHFINLLDGYLAHHNQDTDPLWAPYHSLFVYLSNLPVVATDPSDKTKVTTVDYSFDPPKHTDGPPGAITPYALEWPKLDTIINWIKQQISNIGGISGIIKKFETRIKYDMIQSLINNESVNGVSYRTLNSGGTVKGSGECTALPASWWQNCPNGSVPVGWQGYRDDGSHACHKWWQTGLGELLCQQYDTVYNVRLGGQCDSLVGPGAKKDYDFAAGIIARILSDLGLIPKLAGVIRIVQWIFSKALGNFDWIFDDLADVCSNYMCAASKAGDTYACGDGTGKTNCCPAASDSRVAGRACPSTDTNNLCLEGPAGTCTTGVCPSINLIDAIQKGDVLDPAPVRDLYHISRLPRATR